MTLTLEEIRKANFNRVVYLAFCYMMLLTAFIAAQNLMTQIYRQLGYSSLGQIVFFCMFTGIIASSLFSTHYSKKISMKTAMIGAGSIHVGIIFCGFLATACNVYESKSGVCGTGFLYLLNVIVATCLGCAISFIWLAQAQYVNLCADEESRGTFNGVFFSCMQCSQILSSGIATFVLGFAGQLTFYIILLMFGLVSIVMFSLIQNPVPYSEEKPAVEPEESVNEALISFRLTLSKPKYFFLFAVLTFSGVGISICGTSLGTLVAGTIDSTDNNTINQATGVVFLTLAVGEVLAGYTMGKLADKYNKLKLLTYSMHMLKFAVFLTFLVCYFRSYSIAILCGFSFGFAETAINLMMNVVIGSMFNADPALFSCFRFFQGLGGLFTAVNGIVMVNQMPLLFLVAIGSCLLVLENLYQKNLPIDDDKQSYYRKMEEERGVNIEMKEI